MYSKVVKYCNESRVNSFVHCNKKNKIYGIKRKKKSFKTLQAQPFQVLIMYVGIISLRVASPQVAI